MGKSRAVKKVDQFLAPHLQEFKKSLLRDIEQVSTSRLDQLISNEEEFRRLVRGALEASQRAELSAKKIELKLSLTYLLMGAVGGGISSILFWLLVL